MTATDHIGARIRALRQKKRMSLDELGARAGCHYTSLSRWERGYRAIPPQALASIAAALGVSKRALGAGLAKVQEAREAGERLRNG